MKRTGTMTHGEIVDTLFAVGLSVKHTTARAVGGLRNGKYRTIPLDTVQTLTLARTLVQRMLADLDHAIAEAEHAADRAARLDAQGW